MPGTPDARLHTTTGTALDVFDIIHLFRTHVRWWVIPAIACAMLAAAYSLIAPRYWQATQALIIRPEAAGVSDEQRGKFSDLSEMKTLQETILELAKSQGVIVATLREAGPPAGYRHVAQWPSPLDVEEFRDCVDMRPPGGAEFGKTEVFYLSVRDTDRQRASALAATLCQQLVERMQEIRDVRAHGMVVELERTVAMAETDLANQTTQLSLFESRIGADLAELRNLNAEIGGQGEISQELQAIETERRANHARHRENEQLLKLLAAAQDDTRQLLATPVSLLQSQPAVAQLKTALVAAEVRTASLLGSRSENHPFVIAAREAEVRLRQQLNDELAVAVRGLEVDLALNVDREQALLARLAAGRERFSRLAEARAEYAKLVDSVENHTRLVEAARTNLADARARQAGARSASVISRIDGVETGVSPVGASRKTVTAAGGVGGLVLGLGLVFLFASSPVVRTPDRDGHVHAESIDPVRSQQVSNDSPHSRRRNPSTIKQKTPVNEAVAKGFAHSKKPSNNATTQLSSKAFGIYQGMTLEDAIRSAEQNRPRRIEF
jgi:uncharacterized protein involved in exopolysaccharide biosynthesis